MHKAICSKENLIDMILSLLPSLYATVPKVFMGNTPNSKMADSCYLYTLKSKMVVARDDLGRAGRKRGIEGQVITIRHFGIRCMAANRCLIKVRSVFACRKKNL